ncbi:protein-glutamate O-methyltransferase CheR [Shewanella sp. SNU WT4]|uniref:CheR family methyltransferase n=1 Tax=Shewanella sp. SNU WT4 TaxID=2590015 RepID=UPI001F0E4D88|nr:protein-glutamate O-methyltransferase CheR [Shewanella sp. SNU WT4]
MSTNHLDDEPEFLMTDKNFEYIRTLAYQQTGIVLPERKKHMVYSRLCRRLRVLGHNDFGEYCQTLEHNNDELPNFINALTTNLTSFFRERHHFDFLNDVVMDQWRKQGKKRIRIWSSACSTGEEPYSIAMTLQPMLAQAQLDIKILATDLDTNVLAKAQAGIYPKDNLEHIANDMQKSCINLLGNQFEIKPLIKNHIHFKQLNLLQSWPMKGSFDVIFCRNVMIYFDAETRKKIIARFRQLLSNDGYLIIGHSETLHHISDEFVLIGHTIYRPKTHTTHSLSQFGTEGK